MGSRSGGLASAGRGDDSDLRDIPPAFAPLEYLVGRWTGQGVPKDNPAQQFRGWNETHSWAWIFDRGKPSGLKVTIDGGKFLASGMLTYDPARKLYRLEGSDPRPAGGPIAFEGSLQGTGKHLVLDRVAPDGRRRKGAPGCGCRCGPTPTLFDTRWPRTSRSRARFSSRT